MALESSQLGASPISIITTRAIVYAAEQIYRNEKESGNEKLKYVQNKLREKGFDVDIDAIEAAVMEMKREEVGPIEAVTEIETESEYNDQKPSDDIG